MCFSQTARTEKKVTQPRGARGTTSRRFFPPNLRLLRRTDLCSPSVSCISIIIAALSVAVPGNYHQRTTGLTDRVRSLVAVSRLTDPPCRVPGKLDPLFYRWVPPGYLRLSPRRETCTPNTRIWLPKGLTCRDQLSQLSTNRAGTYVTLFIPEKVSKKQ